MRTSLVIAVMVMGSTLAFAGGEKGAIRVQGLDVPATVWVDGKPAGTTPRTLVLPAGDHVISVRARGFEAFDARVNLAPDAVKFVTPDLIFAAQDDPQWLARVSRAARVGTRGREAGLSQDGRGADVTLYWPRSNVRLGALSTYRIDVGRGYFGNGILEFKVNSRLVHAAPFRVASGVHVARIPAKVRRILRVGDRITWGLRFLGKQRGRTVKASVRVEEGDRIDRRLASLEANETFRTSSARMQEMERIRVLVQTGHGSEAIQRSLAVLGVWPDAASLLGSSLQVCCRRLDLTYTKFGRWVGRVSGGGGGLSRPGVNTRSLRAPLTDVADPLADLRPSMDTALLGPAPSTEDAPVAPTEESAAPAADEESPAGPGTPTTPVEDPEPVEDDEPGEDEPTESAEPVEPAGPRDCRTPGPVDANPSDWQDEPGPGERTHPTPAPPDAVDELPPEQVHPHIREQLERDRAEDAKRRAGEEGESLPEKDSEPTRGASAGGKEVGPDPKPVERKP